jgi:hypothetical protein
VSIADTVDPGSGGLWQGLLPPADGWAVVDTVPAAELEGSPSAASLLPASTPARSGRPASMLDQTVLTVTGAAGPPVRIPMRCLFALSGMGFVGAGDAGETVRVSATSSWLRLDAPLRRDRAAADHGAAAADLTAVCRTCRLAAAKVR